MMTDLTSEKLEERLDMLTQALNSNQSQKKTDGQDGKGKEITPRMRHVRFNPDRNLTMTSEEVATVRITEESVTIADDSTTQL